MNDKCIIITTVYLKHVLTENAHDCNTNINMVELCNILDKHDSLSFFGTH